MAKQSWEFPELELQGTEQGLQVQYRVSHLVGDLGWVDFDFSVPPYFTLVQPLLLNSHQPKQSRADSGTLEIQVNQSFARIGWRI